MSRREIRIAGSERLLVNPGIGFFAAPGLEDGASPALPEERWRFEGSRAFNHPDSGVGFVSGRWARLEPEEGVYDFSPLLEALAAHGRAGRLAVLRVAPYALGDDDVPAWLRARNPLRPEFPFWQVDPNRSDYAPCWARFVRELAGRLDGHPFLSSVDMALVGAWGEGGGTEFMARDSQRLIIDAYLKGFRNTPLQCMLHDPESVGYIRRSGRPVGFGGLPGRHGRLHGSRWSHMLDFYPRTQNFGMGRPGSAGR